MRVRRLWKKKLNELLRKYKNRGVKSGEEKERSKSFIGFFFSVVSRWRGVSSQTTFYWTSDDVFIVAGKQIRFKALKITLNEQKWNQNVSRSIYIKIEWEKFRWHRSNREKEKRKGNCFQISFMQLLFITHSFIDFLAL